MVEARITRAVVMKDDKTDGVVLLGVCQMNDEQVNFKMPFSLIEIQDNPEAIFAALKDKLAEAFDKPKYHIDLQEQRLHKMMVHYAKQATGIIH